MSIDHSDILEDFVSQGGPALSLLYGYRIPLTQSTRGTSNFLHATIAAGLSVTAILEDQPEYVVSIDSRNEKRAEETAGFIQSTRAKLPTLSGADWLPRLSIHHISEDTPQEHDTEAYNRIISAKKQAMDYMLYQSFWERVQREREEEEERLAIKSEGEPAM
jgi:hypothetical protein